jgi:activin receptor type-2A
MFEIYFCCCNNDFCNADSRVVFPNNSISTSGVSPTSTSVYYDSSTITPSGPPAEVAIYASVFTCIIVVGIAIIIALIIGIALFQFNYNNRLDPDRETINSHRETPSPPLCVVDPKIIKTIAQGRFAKVCLATCGNIEVAIKMFNNTIPAKDSWNQEKNIYETPNLEHANILKFIDSEQRDYKGTCTYWLKFDYHPLGSLYDYLQEHNISLIELTLLAKSAACGLAHLHSEIASNGILVKPAITHRDLKSKNILVKNDLTCCISDFGLAIKFIPGEHAFDEAKGQVGTSRYMAPEVLEGAISFNQESFLRIDVYAFGLILWEMTNMCIVSNDPVMKYKPPFDGLVSPNPSIEEMKLVVATERKRPDIPQGFLNMQVNK